jgi:ferredoxin
MGGFVTSLGPECNTSVAIPIPVLDDAILAGLLITNNRIPLPVADVRDRVPFASSSYADVWDGTDAVITSVPEACLRCELCEAAELCPTGAIDTGRTIDRRLCVNCGTCVGECPGNVFCGNLGELDVENRKIPITLRQSDRSRALQLCEHLRDLILEKQFSLTGKSEDLR